MDEGFAVRRLRVAAPAPPIKLAEGEPARRRAEYLDDRPPRSHQVHSEDGVSVTHDKVRHAIEGQPREDRRAVVEEQANLEVTVWVLG